MTSLLPELSRPVKADEIGPSGVRLDLQASAAERDAVANRLGLEALELFEGDLLVQSAIGRQFILEGTIRAEIRQTCVVSGEPVTSSLTFQLRRVYEEDADPLSGLATDDDDIPSSIDDDDPDPLDDGMIDVGEATVEELALQIPAYPRADGAVFQDINEGAPESERTGNPFALLSELKNKTKTKN